MTAMNLCNIFLYTAIISTALFIIKMIIYSLTGADVEVESDFDAITDTDISFNFISLQTILAFLMGFGWSGYTMLIQYHSGGKLAIFIAFVIGLAFMYFSAYLMFCIKKLNKNIVYDYTTLTGNEGKAYTSINPKQQGQIEINFNGKLSILDAVNADDEKIEAFEAVKVIKVENKIIYVTKHLK